MTQLRRLLVRRPPPPFEGDLTGRTCVVTGANAGIGRAIAEGLLRRHARVVLACRSEARGRAARDALVAETGNPRAELSLVDLSSLASVRAFAARFLEAGEPLHVLVDNAGIYPSERRLTDEGIERTWATNVLGPFLLTTLLEPALRAGAPSRVVVVSSKKAGDLDLDDVELERRPWGGVLAYRQSKQATRMLAWARAERLAGTGVTVNVAEPGPVRTSIGASQRGPWGALVGLAFRLAPGPEVGADTPLWLAAAPALEGVTGGFFGERRRLSREHTDPDAIARLVALCEARVAQVP